MRSHRAAAEFHETVRDLIESNPQENGYLWFDEHRAAQLVRLMREARDAKDLTLQLQRSQSQLQALNRTVTAALAAINDSTTPTIEGLDL